MSLFRTCAFLAPVAGALSVLIGAFAAHSVSDPRAAELLRTGAQYQFMHAMATIASLTFWNWGARRARFAPLFFLPGILLFSGSLYALALGAPRLVGALTPLGGICFVTGWLILAWASPQVVARFENLPTTEDRQ